MTRIWMVFALFILFYTGIVSRLVYWQIIKSDELKRAASEQHVLRFDLPTSRGEIYFSDTSPLVINQNASFIYAEPKKMDNINEAIPTLASLLTLDAASISAELLKPERVWVPIKHRVESSIVEALKATGIKGIGFEKESKRYYPEASMAAHIVGFVGADLEGQDRGYFGIEGFYDRELRGKPGSLEVERDVTGAPILIGAQKRVEPEDGRTLLLSIDRSVQHIVETKLNEAIIKYGAKEGSVVIIDPFTGSLIAMASYPSYDPRTYSAYDHELYKNPVVAATYEPGSTFKSLIMAAALHEGVIKPDTTMDENGPVVVSDYTIKTWDDKYHGTITMTDVLKYSSNVGMVFIEKKLGKEILLKILKDFGFGTPTNIDLEDESSPSLRPDAEWREIDLATVSFGQGIAVTPMQMVRAVAALANGGWIMEPHIAREIKSRAGSTVVIKPKKIRRVISEKAAKQITDMMVVAVDAGEAKWAKPKGYRIAGKTGTAQIPVAGHYDETKTIASFVGFAPANAPAFVMLVTLREPSSSQWGSETAAPLFFTIARELFLYYGIPPQ